MIIRTLDGSQPHPSWRGWRRFLATCERRDEADGVVFYGKTNCNYVLFPNGLLVENYGYWGRVMMDRVRNQGANRVLAGIMRRHREVRRLMDSLRKGVSSATTV